MTEARVYAEQEINKFRKEFEEKYLKESERVNNIINYRGIT